MKKQFFSLLLISALDSFAAEPTPQKPFELPEDVIITYREHESGWDYWASNAKSLAELKIGVHFYRKTGWITLSSNCLANVCQKQKNLESQKLTGLNYEDIYVDPWNPQILHNLYSQRFAEQQELNKIKLRWNIWQEPDGQIHC